MRNALALLPALLLALTPALAEEPAPAPLAPLTLTTFNLGLAHGAVALADERLPEQIKSLEGFDSDVLCLQEVWTDADVQAITGALKGTYPYSLRERTEDTTDESTPCGIVKTLRMSRCANKKCLDKGISVFECVDTGPCKERYDALSDDCQRCLGANTSDPSSCAMGGAQEYANDGRNGLLLLSRKPLANAAYVPMEAYIVTRGVLTADIEGYRVMCTHMTADLGMLPYPVGAPVTTWAQEHRAQVDLLAELAEAGRCNVLVGDLNTGPSAADIDAELPESWARLGEQGFGEPIPAPLCTFCSDNPLAGVDRRWNLDHVMFDGCPASLGASYERVFDQPIRVEGHPEDTFLSDHYGVRVRISP